MASSLNTTKPCELPCPKCGADDIMRRYRARGEEWTAEKYGGYYSRFASASSYRMRSSAEHIEHHCRTCQHAWQTKPLKKANQQEPEKRKEAGEVSPSPADFACKHENVAGAIYSDGRSEMACTACGKKF